MVKSGIAMVLVGGLVLFGYFYATSRTELSRTEKAKQAAKDVGDAVRDKGIASLVQGRLLTKFGLDATRFLHAYYDEGRVVVYGLVPAELDQQALIDEAAQVPGVSQVQLLVHPRPAYIAALKPIIGGTPAPQSESGAEPPKPSP
jgi:osmotically-inducible protein OsmY